MKRIVIIGGMGPQASLELHSRIITAAIRGGARSGSDFPCIVHVSLPVDDFISDKTKTTEALKMIVREMKSIGLRFDDSVILACNTAHLLKGDIESSLHIRLLSLIDSTAEHIAAQKIQTIELFASPTSIRTGLYTKALQSRGIEVVEPDEKRIVELERMIRSVIAGNTSRPVNTSGTVKLLGCTELSCLFRGKTNVIDPLDIIVGRLITEGRMV